MRYLFLAAVQLFFFVPIVAEEPNPYSEFTSVAAKSAVAKYKEKLAFLDEKLAAQIALANAAFRADAQLALNEAVKFNDFSEVERLSKFLQQPDADSKEKSDAERKEKDRSSLETITSLKNQLEKMKVQLAALSAPAPIVGTWKYPNGNILELLTDGRVVMAAQTIGIWRKLNDDSYLLSFLHNFAGVSDEMKLQPGGKSILAVGKTGKPFEIVRVAQP